MAMNFSWEDTSTNHTKVLFHIKWDSIESHYLLDAGAYNHEEEFLMINGFSTKVKAVKDVTD